MKNNKKETKIKITTLLSKINEENKKSLKEDKRKMEEIGKQITSMVPNIVETRPDSSRTFDYVSWIWYELILNSIDKEHYFWISYADEFRVETTLIWNGKEYKGSYGVEAIQVSSKSGKELKTKSEAVVDSGMRCYAKLASRITGLFLNLWTEGGNN